MLFQEMRYWSAEKHQERDIFVHFLNDPEKLQQMYADLKTRIEASKIS